VSESVPTKQLVRTRPISGGGVETDTWPLRTQGAGGHGPHKDLVHDAEASQSLLMILLRALGAMHT